MSLIPESQYRSDTPPTQTTPPSPIILPMAYVNPLHSQVGNVSSYSTLSGAVSGGSHVFTSPFRRWLPQPDYSPVSKWRAATATDNRHLPAVFFDFIGHSKQGVNMREISVRGAAGLGQMLVGANDSVFTSTGLQRITLRIMVCCHFNILTFPRAYAYVTFYVVAWIYSCRLVKKH